MTSFRPVEDKAWNYVRPLPGIQPYIQMVLRAPNTFECVALDGLPSKVTSNCDDPPNSFRTSDLFSPHPTIPNAWKYLGRLDDRVTLVNGEKVLPLPYEHQIRENELVREACIFGIGKALPGLIIIPSENAAGMRNDQLLEKLWPVVQAANSKVESFSQISPEMVEILDIGADYPCTDKGTMIRAAFYKKYEDLINSIYHRFETPATGNFETGILLGHTELKAYLANIFVNKLGFIGINYETDFFEAGVDSLQAITARGILMRELDLGGKTLGQNVIFEYPNILSLADHLHSLRTGQEMSRVDDIEIMKELTQKYSTFKRHTPGLDVIDGETVVSFAYQASNLFTYIAASHWRHWFTGSSYIGSAPRKRYGKEGVLSCPRTIPGDSHQPGTLYPYGQRY